MILSGLTDLWIITKDSQYLVAAEKIAHAALTNLVNAGILTEICEPSCGSDGCQFKGVFIRNLAYLASKYTNSNYITFIMKNAASVIRSRKESNYYTQSWSLPLPNDGPDFIRQTSAIDCLNAGLIVGKDIFI